MPETQIEILEKKIAKTDAAIDLLKKVLMEVVKFQEKKVTKVEGKILDSLEEQLKTL